MTNHNFSDEEFAKYFPPEGAEQELVGKQARLSDTVRKVWDKSSEEKREVMIAWAQFMLKVMQNMPDDVLNEVHNGKSAYYQAPEEANFLWLEISKLGLKKHKHDQLPDNIPSDAVVQPDPEYIKRRINKTNDLDLGR